MLELIIAVAVLAILTGIFAPPSVLYFRKAKEAGYMAEAKSVYEAIKLYIMDQPPGELDSFQIWDDMMATSLDRKNHALRKYLGGKVSKGAWIRRIRLGATLESYRGIEYAVDGYIIDVEENGETKIINRPGG